MVWNKLSEKEADKFFIKINLKPLGPYISSGTPRKCKCLICGSIVFPRLGDVKKAKSCVKCQGKLTGKKIRLSPSQVEKIASKMKVKLLEPYENSKTPIKAKCLICRTIIYPTIGRLSVGVGCYYFGQLIAAEKRLIPAEMALSDFKKAKLKVLSEYVNSHTAVKVLCLVCKKMSKKSYKDLKTGRRCYTCGRKAASIKRRLDDKYKIEIAARQNLVPIKEISNVRKNSEFKCLTCKREILMTFASIQGGASCRFCSRTEVDPLEAEKYMIKNHLKPQEPYSKSAAPWKCRCLKCKNIVYPTYNRVTTFGGGCIYCRSAGYNPSFEGHLYLLFNPKFDSYKVGISNIKARIRVHELRGWVVLKKWDFDDGRIPPVLEEKLLDHIRIKWKLPWSVEAKAMPQGGHTETFSSLNLPELRVINLVNSLIKSLQMKGYRK
jgi:hypothetical protein